MTANVIKVGDRERKEMRKLRAKGMSYKDISLKVNRAISTVYDNCRSVVVKKANLSTLEAGDCIIVNKGDKAGKRGIVSCICSKSDEIKRYVKIEGEGCSFYTLEMWCEKVNPIEEGV